MEKVVIIIPTYNEKENIGHTLDVSLEEFEKIEGVEMNILVVDGNSPDGTADVVKPYTERFENVHLLRKEKGGLGGDYVAGMKSAMHKLGADFVGEMDADLQHNPADVRRLVEAIQSGKDVAVGTRFVKGGAIPAGWGWNRKFLSFFGNLYARAMTGMWSAHDITSGFRLSRVKGFIDTIDLDNLFSKRFAYKMDLYYRLHKLGASIEEVPISFAERKIGESKQMLIDFNTNDWLDSYIVVTQIFLERIGLLNRKRFVKVALIGIFGALVQFIVYTAIRLSFSFSPQLSTALSAELAIISNFYLNHHWAFKDRQDSGPLFSKFLSFNVLSIGSPIIQILTVHLGVTTFGEGLVYEWVFLSAGLLLGLIWNYISYSRIVWREKPE